MLYKKTEKLSIIKTKRDYWNIQIKYWAQMPGLYVTVVRADSGNLLL